MSFDCSICAKKKLLSGFTAVDIVTSFMYLISYETRTCQKHFSRDVAACVANSSFNGSLAKTNQISYSNRRINIKNGWEKKGNRGLAVFSYSIPSQLIISETLANLGHRESIKMMVLKTHENRRKSRHILCKILSTK